MKVINSSSDTLNKLTNCFHLLSEQISKFLLRLLLFSRMLIFPSYSKHRVETFFVSNNACFFVLIYWNVTLIKPRRISTIKQFPINQMLEWLDAKTALFCFKNSFFSADRPPKTKVSTLERLWKSVV